jgi:predicted phosphoribosyltransferase/dienelactone hydrolase
MFEDRVDAGRRLAHRLRSHAGVQDEDVVVLGLPRGGVPVAAEVAHALGAPLDVIVVRKLGVPGQPELAMGAIGEGGVQVLDAEVLRLARVDQRGVDRVVEREREELERRVRRYRTDHERVPLTGRVAVIVDDGLATGSTAKAACRVARQQGARRVVLAVPVAPADWAERLADVADDLVAVETPEDFGAVGRWYRRFDPTPEGEVVHLLAGAAPSPSRRVAVAEVRIPVGPVELPGELVLPPGAFGVVLFAHGSGSSRHSPRNQAVARDLVAAGFGVLLFDLLTPEEEGDRSNVFDVPLLGGRLATASRWLRGQEATAALPIAYFGASTGAGAALWAAAEPDLDVAAVVSRGGRPDLAGDRLGHVRCPTLLVVGSRDREVLALNERAERLLPGESRISVVSGATHLFEEPGALEEVAHLAVSWFAEHLVAHLDRTPADR